MGENGGSNVYNFVLNNPQSFVDIAGLYEIDVHYYLTYWLALRTGCFKPEEAQDIANEDQRTDENPETWPALGTTEKQQMQNAVFHALSEDAIEGVGSSFLWGAAMGELGTHGWIGRYLHYLQDTFSHAGYHDDITGHSPLNVLDNFWTGYGDHSSDKTAYDPPRARRMAYATWDALVKYALITKCKCDAEWDNIFWLYIDEFNKVTTNNPRGSAIDATKPALDNPGIGDPAALMRKRRILKLRERNTNEW
jgi:hypothetical protein